MKEGNTKKKIELFSKFLEEFQDETDRGASILAGTILEEKLKNILTEYFIECRQSKELLDGNNAPIGTFSSRLNMAYALGLISDYEYIDCNIIRKIRNEFAHKFELAFSFENPKIKDIVYTINAPTPGDKESFKGKPRALYINGVICLYMNWLWREDFIRVKELRLKRPDWEKITWGGIK